MLQGVCSSFIGGVVGGMGGVVVGIFCCQIYICCWETKLLICHKGGSSFMGWGGRWGGGSVV